MKKPHEQHAQAALDDILSDTLDLTGKLCAVVRSICNDIADRERAKRKCSKRDRAISRWQVYLGVSLVKLSEGVEALAPSRNVRAALLLVRSMYEYQQKAQYFLTHRQEAFEQYGSIGARQYAELTKLNHPDPNVAPRLAAAYLEWKRTSGTRDEHSGNVGVSAMHLQITDKAKIKNYRDGSQYTEEFQTAYGFPSLYVHGEPLLMGEVFPKFTDDANWDFTEDRTYLDYLSVVAMAYSYILRYCVKTTNAYGLDYSRVRALSPIARSLIRRQAVLRGYDKWLAGRLVTPMGLLEVGRADPIQKPPIGAMDARTETSDSVD